MFIDKALITLRAGKGGDGCVSFHREKYISAGGPDGGDGGRGGDILFVADSNKTNLVEFKYKKKYAAPDGEPGRSKRCSGKRGEDLVISVPYGTLVRERATGLLLADISDDTPVLIAKGGRGGWGNIHFATPTRQIPRFAKPGKPGQALEVELELKLLADVGLIGFPNVGKSTLLSVVSDAKPVIANYHFTTLTPVLGVVRLDEETSFVMADIPGLIEGASEGVGLGHAFLRHVDRCRLMVHVVDVSGSEGRNPLEDFDIINAELKRFSPELANRPMLVAANKCDIADNDRKAAFSTAIKARGLALYEISAATTQGVDALIKAVAGQLSVLPPVVRYQPDAPLPAPSPDDRSRYTIEKRDGAYHVEADWLDYMLGSVNMEDYESLQYLQKTLRTVGIIDRLEEMGIQEGETVCLNNFAFDFVR